tara:strand:+ start:655 stop:1080 length:426 start_codon:yes stop_codon:yes gene_type:complete
MNKYFALKQVATKYYPTETNYCTVIAAAIALDIKFGAARSLLYRGANRVTAKGTSVSKLHTVLRAQGYKCRLLELELAKTPVSAQKALKKTKGTYFIYTKNHVATVQDGVMQDWSNNEHRKNLDRVESIFKIEKLPHTTEA